MDPMAVSFQPVLDQQIEVIPIFVVKENILPAVPAQHHMIEPTGYVKSWFSGHGCELYSGISNNAIAQA